METIHIEKRGGEDVERAKGLLIAKPLSISVAPFVLLASCHRTGKCFVRLLFFLRIVVLPPA